MAKEWGSTKKKRGQYRDMITSLGARLGDPGFGPSTQTLSFASRPVSVLHS